MAGCGYVCPQCEGRGFTGTGENCDWCSKQAEMAPEDPVNEDAPQKIEE